MEHTSTFWLNHISLVIVVLYVTNSGFLVRLQAGIRLLAQIFLISQLGGVSLQVNCSVFAIVCCYYCYYSGKYLQLWWFNGLLLQWSMVPHIVDILDVCERPTFQCVSWELWVWASTFFWVIFIVGDYCARRELGWSLKPIAIIKGREGGARSWGSW